MCLIKLSISPREEYIWSLLEHQFDKNCSNYFEPSHFPNSNMRPSILLQYVQVIISYYLKIRNLNNHHNWFCRILRRRVHKRLSKELADLMLTWPPGQGREWDRICRHSLKSKEKSSRLPCYVLFCNWYTFYIKIKSKMKIGWVVQSTKDKDEFPCPVYNVNTFFDIP